MSERPNNITEVGLALDTLDPLGVDPHSLDALLHGPGDARLGSALEELLRLITLLVSGQLKPCLATCKKENYNECGITREVGCRWVMLLTGETVMLTK